MAQYAFSKYSGCGNDFILIDNRKKSFPTHNRGFLSLLCSRKIHIGADGIIFLENSVIADFSMRIFNSDGSEAEMCGNGIRCLAKFIKKLNYPKNAFTIQTMHRKHSVLLLENDLVQVEMGPPADVEWQISIQIDDTLLLLDKLDTGVPHAVLFCENIESIDLEKFGPKLRHHPYFFPKGTNVNIATIKNEKIFLRTFERGVEAETLACGTGATAVAIAAIKNLGMKSPVKIFTKSNDCLEIQAEFNELHHPISVNMTGPATFSFSGTLEV